MSRYVPAWIATALWALSLTVFAHGPTPHRIVETVEIKAAPAAVWKAVGDFGGMASWNPLVSKATADNGNASDSRRHLMLGNGGELIESMDFYDAANMTFTYRLMNEDTSHFPVSFYSATITVKPAAAGSEVEWTGNFYRADTHNEPTEGMDDEAAEKAIHDFFSGGLAGLKKTIEH